MHNPDQPHGKGKHVSNAYARELGTLYGRIPKAVLAAIAISKCTDRGSRLGDAALEIAAEWEVLHKRGIVRQPLPAKYRQAVLESKG